MQGRVCGGGNMGSSRRLLLLSAINDATGARVTGLRMMSEFARQMTEKQGRPLQVVPDVGAGATSLPYTGRQVGS